jgi:hypothetical protein
MLAVEGPPPVVLRSHKDVVKQKVEETVARINKLKKPTVERKKLATRLDSYGKEINPGKWKASDFAGHYHASQIKNRFPIPGSAVAIDQWRANKRQDLKNDIEDHAAAAMADALARAKTKALKVSFDNKVDFEIKFKSTVNDVNNIIDQKSVLQKQGERSSAPVLKETATPSANKAATQLHDDVENLRLERLEQVLQHQFDPEDSQGITEWERVQIEKNKKRLNLYDVPNIDVADNVYGCTPLFKAVAKGAVDVVALLLKYKASPNAINYLGETPMHHAFRAWDVHNINPMVKFVKVDKTFKVIRQLVEAGGDINTKDSTHQESVLHLAARHGPTDLVEYLLQHDASPSVVNREGKTPLAVAQAFCPDNPGGFRVRLHALETSRLLQRWDAVKENMKLHEFQAEWSEFINNPYSNLTQISGQDVLDDIRIGQRKVVALRLRRGDFASEVIDEIDRTHEEIATTPFQAEEELAHVQHIAHENTHKYNAHMSGGENVITRPAKQYNKLGIPLDDYLHRDRYPGFDPHKNFRPAKDMKAYCTSSGERRLQLKEQSRQKAEAKNLERLRVLRKTDPNAWRRQMAAREVLKDSDPVKWGGAMKGRPSLESSIMRSGSNNHYNELHSKVHPQLHVPRPGDIGKLCKKGDDGKPKNHDEESEAEAEEYLDEAAHAAKKSNTYQKPKLNAEYALPPDKPFSQVANERVDAPIHWTKDKVRVNHERQRAKLTDPWSKTDADHKQGDGYEDTYSAMPIEGFDIFMGNDPYRASKMDGAGTTIHYMCEHYPKTGSLKGAADYSVANIDEHVPGFE